jgi:hypothetical protein
MGPSYQLVKNLRPVNQIVQTKHPVVPKPYIVLRKIPYEYKWFSVIDLEDAFLDCPLHVNSWDIFAFEWEDRPLRMQAAV